jgi:hypothetical protein
VTKILEGYPGENDYSTYGPYLIFHEPSGDYGWSTGGAISYGYPTAEEADRIAKQHLGITDATHTA